ncbi:hypothetical protein GBAR_LOCUS20163, partial [Geodia barretti]
PGTPNARQAENPGAPLAPCSLRPGSHDFLHRQRVGACMVSIGGGGHIVGAAFPRREGHPAVIAPAAVAVVRAIDQVAVRIVNPPESRVPQCAGAARRSPQIDAVGRAGPQRDCKPVPVARVIDLARDRPIHRDPPGRVGPGRHRVGGRAIRHRQRVGACMVSLAGGGHIVGAAFPRREGHPAVIAPGAVVVVRRAANQIALRIVYPAQIRVEQGAAAGPLSLQIDAVGRAGHQGDRKPVPVARVIDLARDRSSDRDPAGRAGCRCVVV